METLTAYLERKTRELTMLEGLLADPVVASRAESVEQVVERKLALRARLLAQAFGDNPTLMETNVHRGKRQALGPWKLRYLYQRYELGVDGPSPYPRLASDPRAPSLIQELHWFSSGMGAIAAVLMALGARAHVPPTLLVLEDSYFETLQLLEWLPGQFQVWRAPTVDALIKLCGIPRKPGEGLRVLLLDSIAREDPTLVPSRLAAEQVDLILYDSTCHADSSARVVDVARAVEAPRIPVVMLRSHQKLDTLGFEYGRLGSALFLTGPLLPAKVHDFVSRLATRAGKYAQVLGSAMVPGFLPPFAGDPAFGALNDERIERTVAANRAAEHWLRDAAANFELRSYHHGCFLTLQARDPALRGKDALGEKVMDLVRHAEGRALPIRRATSFGFDFVALTVFPEPDSDRSLLRVAFGDLPGEVVASCCELLVEELDGSS